MTVLFPHSVVGPSNDMVLRQTISIWFVFKRRLLFNARETLVQCENSFSIKSYLWKVEDAGKDYGTFCDGLMSKENLHRVNS